VRAAVAGKVQSNHISVTKADYMTTALHFPGLLSNLEPNIEGCNSEFEFELIIRSSKIRTSFNIPIPYS